MASVSALAQCFHPVVPVPHRHPTCRINNLINQQKGNEGQKQGAGSGNGICERQIAVIVGVGKKKVVERSDKSSDCNKE